MSIPTFFLLIGIELAVAWVKGATVYCFNDSINDLSTGILNQVLAVFTGGARIGIYAAIYSHLRVFTLPEGANLYVLAHFLGTVAPLLAHPRRGRAPGVRGCDRRRR